VVKRLPNGWLVELSNEVFVGPDGTFFEERGLRPEVEIELCPAGDPVAGHWRAVGAAAKLAKKL